MAEGNDVTPQDTARIIAILKGAFPNVEIDDATAAVWAASMEMADAEVAFEAAQRWVETEQWWPTVAAFNGTMTAVRREMRDEQPAITTGSSAIHCDGTGWFDRGKGMEPCPTCNPWNRERWLLGDWNNRRRPPANLVMPPPCSPSHAGEGSAPATRQRAMQLVLLGLREHYTEMGLDGEEVEERIQRRMPTVLSAVSSVPE